MGKQLLSVRSVNRRQNAHRTIEHVHRVKAIEHFAILVQLDAFQLARIGVDGAEPVRPVG